MKDSPLADCLDARVVADVQQHADTFARRDPFRHVVIDDFLAPALAASLLDAFPPFERGNARNEAGAIGGKATVERLPELGPPYAALDQLVRSAPFLDFLSRVTGIPDLLYDPFYFGGGTHENRHGQDLDPHVDFNRHPVEGWHRRLNLIVYLNREWQDRWGGSLDLHSDPRSPDDRVRRVTPLYNRCVIFETTEWSWHGFSRISLPTGREGLSRKSIALYFYTRERPPEELAGTHSTIYVDRPLPDRLRAGYTLADTDVAELRDLLARRDQHIQRQYGEAARLTAELEEARTALFGGKLGRVRHYVALARRLLRR